MDIPMRMGLRRNRRISRSTRASMRPISAPPQHEWAVRGRGRLKLVAEGPPRVVHEDVVEGRALHGERLDGHAGARGRFHQGEGRGGAVLRADAEDVLLGAHRLYVRKRLQPLRPVRGNAPEANLNRIATRDRGLEIERGVEGLELPGV